MARNTTEQYGHYYVVEQPPAPVGRYAEWLERAEKEVGIGRLLEVGAGSGGFVQVAKERGWSVDAIEVAPAGVERLRSKGANVFQGDLVAAAYADNTFDLVVSLEVLEHLPRPGEHLRELGRITRAGGLLLLSTPNFSGVSRRWLGLRWRVIDPEHLGYFTPSLLRRTVQNAGFRKATVSARTLDISTWRASARSQEPVSFDPQASARLRDAVEGRRVLRMAKDALNVLLSWTSLGDSLLVWARK